jgi:hypothetical protein
MEHLTDETQRQLAYNRYKDMSVKDLQEMLLIMPRPQQAQNTQQTTPIYWGSQGGPPPGVQLTNEEPLLAPTYNFEDHRLARGKTAG